MKVLVLDDDKSLHPYYTSVLSRVKGIKSVTTVSNVHEFGRALLDAPHIIFCDIYMEPMRGCDIIRNYRKEIGKTPIVMMSCSDNLREISEELIEEGFDVVESLEKPVTPLVFHELLGR